jgi:hypothetical protein
MSTRVVAQEILALSALAKVGVEEIQHFIAGISGIGAISFDVAGDHCAVVVAIEQFNVDDALTRTASQSQGGALITQVQTSTWSTGSDVLYLFPPGKATITLAATPQGGKTYSARAIGYLLPFSAYPRLSRMATRILS